MSGTVKNIGQAKEIIKGHIKEDGALKKILKGHVKEGGVLKLLYSLAQSFSVTLAASLHLVVLGENGEVGNPAIGSEEYLSNTISVTDGTYDITLNTGIIDNSDLSYGGYFTVKYKLTDTLGNVIDTLGESAEESPTFQNVVISAGDYKIKITLYGVAETFIINYDEENNPIYGYDNVDVTISCTELNFATN